jgi:hypothetical protein
MVLVTDKWTVICTVQGEGTPPPPTTRADSPAHDSDAKR